MSANDHPGCCGAAARLPKRPGSHMLTPPSSAAATVGDAIKLDNINDVQNVGRSATSASGICLTPPPNITPPEDDGAQYGAIVRKLRTSLLQAQRICSQSITRNTQCPFRNFLN